MHNIYKIKIGKQCELLGTIAFLAYISIANNINSPCIKTLNCFMEEKLNAYRVKKRRQKLFRDIVNYFQRMVSFQSTNPKRTKDEVVVTIEVCISQMSTFPIRLYK